MLTALALIAACEIIRMALSTIQILLLVNDAFKNDKEVIGKFLQEAERQLTEGSKTC